MLHDVEDIIVAIASPPGASLAGIVRVSGPGCMNLVKQIFRHKQTIEFEPDGFAYCLEGEVFAGIEIGYVPAEFYCWPNERSYTRQPCFEIHTIGSEPILHAIEHELIARGVRLARPGEFTMRAFLAGRMDLSQAEAVIGVIDARDKSDLQNALKQLAGGLTTPLQNMRDSLLDLLANLEAGLDFVEEDIEFISSEQMTGRLTKIQSDLELMVRQICSRSQAVGAPRAVLVGKPNAGKSSLFNALIGNDQAIVSNQSGTTRDYLAASVEHHGFSFVLVDSAGVDEFDQLENVSTGLLSIDEQATVQTNDQKAHADLVIHCTASNASPRPDREKMFAGDGFQAVIHVLTKSDLLDRDIVHQDFDLPTSAHSGQGCKGLLDLVVQSLLEIHNQDATHSSIASRCLESLESAIQAIIHATESVATNLGDEITAIEVREALDCLGRIVGVVYTDDILDRVFSQFCIGK